MSSTLTKAERREVKRKNARKMAVSGRSAFVIQSAVVKRSNGAK